MASYEIEKKWGAAAFEKISALQLSPTPENYTLWYTYASQKNPELNDEIDKALAQKLPFTASLCASLYQRFFRESNPLRKPTEEAAVSTQKMLKDVLRVVNEFSGETKNYNKGLDDYIEEISKDHGSTDIKDIVKQLVGATLSLKQRGEQMSARLDESRKEIDKLRENLQQVTEQAERDGLTGLFNRRSFERMLEEIMAASQEPRNDLCLIMLDVDHFKKFNDTYGHLMGDEVLKIVARTLIESVKGRDVVARFGGEEFVVVLPATPLEGGMRVAEAIRQSIASKSLKRKDTGESFGQITVSLGVAGYRHGIDDIPKLTKRADDALYQSKRLGRNRVTREGA